MTKSKQQKELAKDRLRVWIGGACEPVNPGDTKKAPPLVS